MIDGDGRGSRLSGFWACLTGGAAIALLLVFLDPVMRQEDCPNYGANGNASAFANADWDLWFPLVLLSWWALIAMEQVLPLTHRHRGRVEIAARGVCALALAVVSSCCLLMNVALVCH
ncbi:hypothetical protein AB0K00_15565 [Dactylosporangium sp. NPDC049525]|uniref:hypothetical protein n=1 Tax=Dactylosporangium sp. NPDC049525 TaxID=3154730 RepID=UPI0034480D74